MAYKIDVRIILKDHFKTLVNAKTKRPDFRDYFFFLVLPASISFLLVYNCLLIKDQFVSSIIGGLSIYVALSLNFIVLLFELSSKDRFKEPDERGIIKQTVANISVSIFYSILIIVFSLLSNYSIISVYFNFLTYFLIIEFILTLLMILKRVYILLSQQLDSM